MPLNTKSIKSINQSLSVETCKAVSSVTERYLSVQSSTLLYLLHLFHLLLFKILCLSLQLVVVTRRLSAHQYVFCPTNHQSKGQRDPLVFDSTYIRPPLSQACSSQPMISVMQDTNWFRGRCSKFWLSHQFGRIFCSTLNFAAIICSLPLLCQAESPVSIASAHTRTRSIIGDQKFEVIWDGLADTETKTDG